MRVCVLLLPPQGMVDQEVGAAEAIVSAALPLALQVATGDGGPDRVGAGFHLEPF